MISPKIPRGQILVLSTTFALTQSACDYLVRSGYQVVIPPKLLGEERATWINHALNRSCAVIVGHDRIDRTLIERAPQLKVIAKQGVGLDNIDTRAANEYGIKVISATGGNSDSVADMAILLMLAVTRRLLPANSIVRKGGWERIIGHEISNKNLGIIGFGEIGKRVALRARGFSMSIAYYDVVEYIENPYLLNETRMELPALMSWADVVSIHIPLNSQTEKLIDRNLLSLMKPTAYLINTSRGGVVDEAALFDALKNNRIAGAGLDVFEQEPPVDLSLIRLPNVVATPHMAAYTIEAIERVSMQIAKSVVEDLGVSHINR